MDMIKRARAGNRSPNLEGMKWLVLKGSYQRHFTVRNAATAVRT